MRMPFKSISYNDVKYPIIYTLLLATKVGDSLLQSNYRL